MNLKFIHARKEKYHIKIPTGEKNTAGCEEGDLGSGPHLSPTFSVIFKVAYALQDSDSLSMLK